MLRWIVTGFAFLIGLLILLGVSTWYLLQPPVVHVPSQEKRVFSNITVINPGHDRRPEQLLTIDAGTIVSISAQRPESSIPEDTRPLAGTYALPGLIDMHVHHTTPFEWELYGLLFLMHGVTTVRDVGAQDLSLLAIRQHVTEGAYPGPRLYACGPIIDGAPAWPFDWFWSVATPAEARKAVEDIAGADVDCVKVYSGLSAEALETIHTVAQQYRLPVIGHVPFATPFEKAQLSDVQHLTGVPATPVELMETVPDRERQWGAFQMAWQDLEQDRIDTIVQTSVEQGIAHTPTLTMWSQLPRLRNYPKGTDDPVVHLLPRWYRELLWQPWEVDDPSAFYDALEAGLPKMKHVVRRLHEAGVRIHTGSDTPSPFVIPGFSLHQELRQLVDAGLTPEAAWVAATRAAGQTLGLPKLGSLEEGAPADFLLFRRDPTQDLAALASLEAVVAQGRLYTKLELDAAFSRHRGYFEGWLYDWVSMKLAELLLEGKHYVRE